jgi:hypothetical protein
MAFLTLWTSSVATWTLLLCGGLGFRSETGLVSLGGYVRVFRLELLVPRGCSDICRRNLPPDCAVRTASPSLPSPSDSSPWFKLCRSLLMPIDPQPKGKQRTTYLEPQEKSITFEDMFDAVGIASVVARSAKVLIRIRAVTE